MLSGTPHLSTAIGGPNRQMRFLLYVPMSKSDNSCTRTKNNRLEGTWHDTGTNRAPQTGRKRSGAGAANGAGGGKGSAAHKGRDALRSCTDNTDRAVKRSSIRIIRRIIRRPSIRVFDTYYTPTGYVFVKLGSTPCGETSWPKSCTHAALLSCQAGGWVGVVDGRGEGCKHCAGDSTCGRVLIV